jgi:cob(I)alamin adenosyltransferase
MATIDDLVSHIWMVRTFIKHCEEVEEDDELAEVHRELYDFAHALGPPLKAGDAAAYLKTAKKKLSKLKKATELFSEIQPEISSHTNFQMAERSLRLAVDDLAQVLDDFARE